jgi:hypothetical protein
MTQLKALGHQPKAKRPPLNRCNKSTPEIQSLQDNKSNISENAGDLWDAKAVNRGNGIYVTLQVVITLLFGVAIARIFECPGGSTAEDHVLQRFNIPLAPGFAGARGICCTHAHSCRCLPTLFLYPTQCFVGFILQIFYILIALRSLHAPDNRRIVGTDLSDTSRSK